MATGIRGLDPVAAGVLKRSELERCQKDPTTRLVISKPVTEVKPPYRKEPRYTPLSKRQDRPDAIAWLLRHHPELTDQQIGRLLGTTKTTIQAVRERTHWKSPEIRPRDPVFLGLCTQIELDDAVAKAKASLPQEPAATSEEVPGTGEQPSIGMPAEFGPGEDEVA